MVGVVSFSCVQLEGLKRGAGTGPSWQIFRYVALQGWFLGRIGGKFSGTAQTVQRMVLT